MEIVESEYRKKLNGYRCSHRNRWLLVSSGVITLQAFSLLEFYIDISDFDQKHKTYGTFEVDFIEIAKIFACSQGTIRNWHKELIKLEIIFPVKKRTFRLAVPKRYISPGLWKGEASFYAKFEKDQTIEIIFQSITKGIESVENNAQPDKKNQSLPLKKTPARTIVSSKDEYSFNSIGFNEDDREWIKDALKE